MNWRAANLTVGIVALFGATYVLSSAIIACRSVPAPIPQLAAPCALPPVPTWRPVTIIKSCPPPWAACLDAEQLRLLDDDASEARLWIARVAATCGDRVDSQVP